MNDGHANGEHSGGAYASGASSPYGPGTPRIRRFLVRFAGLGSVARREVTDRYATLVESDRYLAAEAQLGETIARAGREDARDALAGPLMQLVRLEAAPTAHDDEVLSGLDPVAEPALAALLALLVADLLPATVFETLYEPFAVLIPDDN